VEIVPQAIADAKDNAKRNGVANVEFFVGKAEEVLPEFYERESRKRTEIVCAETNGCDIGSNAASMLRPDVIVVDPPRKGCDEKCLDVMLKMQPERIVYVSCDSATLARDLKLLCKGGYEIRKIQAVDQFPQGVHVETVCLLSKLIAKPDTYVELSLDMEDYYKIKEKGDGSV
jgi:23S rRNA (uracil1939-C5)-methyltransferase